ncbi:MAG: YjdF family protein [Enterococcaceae bacterium]|jgi:hypothetical protein|nr:YjdF family protein [Enterococcaceae bacterium]MCI1919205.1 YjdF family protein [Enterococcaceae bacterium]
MKLTVFFDGSFWCGLIEDSSLGKTKIYKHVFGAEPKNSEILAFVDHQLTAELEKLPSVAADFKKKTGKSVSPKRMQRLVNREKKRPVFSTKAQMTMQKTLEMQKVQRKKSAKARKKVAQQAQFLKKQEKKRQKKKGH